MIGLLFLLKLGVFAISEPTSSASGMTKLYDKHYTVTKASIRGKMKIKGKSR